MGAFSDFVTWAHSPGDDGKPNVIGTHLGQSDAQKYLDYLKSAGKPAPPPADFNPEAVNADVPYPGGGGGADASSGGGAAGSSGGGTAPSSMNSLIGGGAAAAAQLQTGDEAAPMLLGTPSPLRQNLGQRMPPSLEALLQGRLY